MTLYRLVLLCAVLLPPVEARADFFDDLGDAVGKLGDAVGDAATDAVDAVDRTFTADPNKTAPNLPANAAPPLTITHDAPSAEGTTAGFFSDRQPSPSVSQQTASTRHPLPSEIPFGRSQNSGSGAIARRGGVIVDDAPPPRAAPRRRPVEMVGILPEPSVKTANTPLPTSLPATVIPTIAAATTLTQSSNKTDSALVPTSNAPATIINASAPNNSQTYTVRFNGAKAELQSRMSTAPHPVKSLLSDAAQRVKTGFNLRLSLTAYSSLINGQAAQARQQSFARALQIKEWLVGQGLRPTQIDLHIMAAPSDNDVADRVDLEIVPDLS